MSKGTREHMRVHMRVHKCLRRLGYEGMRKLEQALGVLTGVIVGVIVGTTPYNDNNNNKQ